MVPKVIVRSRYALCRRQINITMKKFYLYFLLLTALACTSRQEELQSSGEVIFHLPDGTQCVELLSAGVDSSDYYIREILQGHGLIISGNAYMSMDDTLPCYYRLPFDSELSDIAWVGGDCFLAKDSTIYYAEDEGRLYAILKTDNHINRIWPIESGIYFSTDSTLSFFRFSIAEGEPVTKVPGIIRDVAPLDKDDCFLAVDSCIVFLSGGEPLLVANDSLIIKSVVLHTDDCLFYATDKSVYFVDVDGVKIDVVNKGARQLSIIGDNLIIIFNDNSSVVITNISNYHKSLLNSE